MTLCERLEGLVDREHIPAGDLQQQEIQAKNDELLGKDSEIQRRDAKIDVLLSKLQVLHVVLTMYLK